MLAVVERRRRVFMNDMDEALLELRQVVGLMSPEERVNVITTKEQCVAMRMARIPLTSRETGLAMGFVADTINKWEARAMAKLRAAAAHLDIHRVPDKCIASKSAKSAKLTRARGWKENELDKLRWQKDKLRKRASRVRSSAAVSDDAQDD